MRMVQLRSNPMFSESLENPKPIIFWLRVVIFMVFAMVFIGGITRLTDSGLSMVEWKPIVGSIPPLNEAQWQEAFDKYQAFPEFKKINYHMELDEFKKIFFWEYFHRLWGRLIGLVFFVPMLFFTIQKKIPSALFKKLSLAFVLGGSQGLLGWYMVKSGLVDRPDVSHFRLCAHFMLALTIMGYVYFLILQLKHPERNFKWGSQCSKFIMGFSFVLIVQYIYGAFVAGLDAGLTHNTFPKMGRYWIPAEINLENLLSLALFNNVVVIQFIHRGFAYTLFIFALFMLYKSRSVGDLKLKRSMQLIGLLVFVQFSLGIATLLSLVSIAFASMHQVVAVFLFLVTVSAVFYSLTKSKTI